MRLCAYGRRPGLAGRSGGGWNQGRGKPEKYQRLCMFFAETAVHRTSCRYSNDRSEPRKWEYLRNSVTFIKIRMISSLTLTVFLVTHTHFLVQFKVPINTQSTMSDV